MDHFHDKFMGVILLAELCIYLYAMWFIITDQKPDDIR